MLGLSDRMTQIMEDLPRCPKCGTAQVQVTAHWTIPAEWKCRRCGHRFEHEPKELK